MGLIEEDAGLRKILAEARRIAVVGLSSNPQRPSHQVAAAMQAEGYDIVPVNPNESQVLGENAFTDIGHIPGIVDLVQVFRRSEHVPAIVDACIEHHVHVLWLQEGVSHAAAARRAADAGIKVVMDRCMLKEYRRLLG